MYVCLVCGGLLSSKTIDKIEDEEIDDYICVMKMNKIKKIEHQRDSKMNERKTNHNNSNGRIK